MVAAGWVQEGVPLGPAPGTPAGPGGHERSGETPPAVGLLLPPSKVKRGMGVDGAEGVTNLSQGGVVEGEAVLTLDIAGCSHSQPTLKSLARQAPRSAYPPPHKTRAEDAATWLCAEGLHPALPGMTPEHRQVSPHSCPQSQELWATGCTLSGPLSFPPLKSQRGFLRSSR